MTPDEAVAALDALSGREQGCHHGEADAILLQAVDPQVRAAYERLQARSSGWYYE